MLMVRRNPARGRKSESPQGAVAILKEKTVQGCVSLNSDPKKSILRKAGQTRLNVSAGQAVKFSGGTWYEVPIRERKGPSRGCGDSCTIFSSLPLCTVRVHFHTGFSDVYLTCALVVTLPTYSRWLKTRWKRSICHLPAHTNTKLSVMVAEHGPTTSEKRQTLLNKEQINDDETNKMKPDWDKLMEQWNSGDRAATSVVAEVGCTSDTGKPLCDQNGVRGFPTLFLAVSKQELHPSGF